MYYVQLFYVQVKYLAFSVHGIAPTTEDTQSSNGHFVHSTMGVKSAQCGEGGRGKPTPVHYIYHQVLSRGVRPS